MANANGHEAGLELELLLLNVVVVVAVGVACQRLVLLIVVVGLFFHFEPIGVAVCRMANFAVVVEIVAETVVVAVGVAVLACCA